MRNQDRPKAPGARLAIASLALGAAAIVCFYVSVRRIEEVQQLSLRRCLIEETPVYRTVNALCGILPTAALVCGALALMRSFGKTGGLAAKIAAIAAIALPAVATVIYFAKLLELTSAHPH